MMQSEPTILSNRDMPRHDIPDDAADANVIDFRRYLRKPVDLPARRTTEQAHDRSAKDAFRYAEYGDGSRPRFGIYDLLWLLPVMVVCWIGWEAVRH
jgi:hypothetical protein